MELFSRKKNTKAKEVKAEAKESKAKVTKTASAKTDSVASGDTSTALGVLVRSHITEKAAILADANGYVFVVSPRATKTDIKQAVKEVYGKDPVKVNIVKKPGKTVLRRKGRGTRKGLTKAYVFLKKGETIDIV